MKEEEILFNLKKERIELVKRLARLDTAIKAFEEVSIKSTGVRTKSRGKVTHCKHCGKEFICFKVQKAGNYCSVEHNPSYIKREEERNKLLSQSASSSSSKKDKGTILVASADRR